MLYIICQGFAPSTTLAQDNFLAPGISSESLVEISVSLEDRSFFVAASCPDSQVCKAVLDDFVIAYFFVGE